MKRYIEGIKNSLQRVRYDGNDRRGEIEMYSDRYVLKGESEEKKMQEWEDHFPEELLREGFGYGVASRSRGSKGVKFSSKKKEVPLQQGECSESSEEGAEEEFEEISEYS
jgi:hypothetical protein